MPGPLHAFDWAIIGAYVLFALWVGVHFARRASSSVDEYFLSGRSLPWYVAGTSMVATSFAADTPLLITGWVRDDGIWKNWIWWCYGIAVAIQIFLFARWWRRAGVMTKAELVELRYAGKEAQVLRGTLGFLHATITNTATLCWVILAAGKISTVLFEVDQDTGIAVACLVAMTYSLLAGFWGVVVTDLVQFTFAMVGAIALAWISWSAVGGGEVIAQAVSEGVIPASRLDFVPAAGGDRGFWTAALASFAVYLGVWWWAAENVDGSTVSVQRISAAREPREGMLAVLWYAVAHYALRPWCWILVGLASMLVLPHLEVSAPSETGQGARVVSVPAEGDAHAPIVLETAAGERLEVPLRTAAATDDWYPLPLVEPSPAGTPEAEVVRVSAGDTIAGTDSERAYMVMMVRYLPIGLLGLVAASLIAAFMSTIDTHVNLAASFFVNDVYRRFGSPDRPERHYVLVARIASVVVLLLGAALAREADSVRALFIFFITFLAGVGPIYVLRWLWWRIRASTEIVAMLTSAVVSTALTHLDLPWPEGPLSPGGELSSAGRMVCVALASLTTAGISLALLRAPDPARLVAFYRRTRPLGCWGPVRALVEAQGGVVERSDERPAIVGVAGALGLVFGLTLGLGFLFLGRDAAMLVALGVTLAGGLAVRWALARVGD